MLGLGDADDGSQDAAEEDQDPLLSAAKVEPEGGNLGHSRPPITQGSVSGTLILGIPVLQVHMNTRSRMFGGTSKDGA